MTKVLYLLSIQTKQTDWHHSSEIKHSLKEHFNKHNSTINQIFMVVRDVYTTVMVAF